VARLRRAPAEAVGREFAACGLTTLADRSVAELSGGEQQRLAIARAVVHRPAILIADEPTGNLDATYAAEIGELFRSFNQVGVTVVIATHDAAFAARLKPRLIALAEGRVAP
jgi:cell division transport system ATP-binding protein